MKKAHKFHGDDKRNGLESVLMDLKHAIRCHGSQSAVAKMVGVSPQFVNDVLNRRREPSGALLKFFRYERVVLYRRTGEPTLFVRAKGGGE